MRHLFKYSSTNCKLIYYLWCEIMFELLKRLIWPANIWNFHMKTSHRKICQIGTIPFQLLNAEKFCHPTNAFVHFYPRSCDGKKMLSICVSHQTASDILKYFKSRHQQKSTFKFSPFVLCAVETFDSCKLLAIHLCARHPDRLREGMGIGSNWTPKNTF